MPISTSSREKSTSPVLVLMRTSISGLARWKPPSRGTTHFMSNDAVVVTVRCQPLYLMADRGLGDAQFVSGIGKAHMAGSSLKGTQSVERRQASLHDAPIT